MIGRLAAGAFGASMVLALAGCEKEPTRFQELKFDTLSPEVVLSEQGKAMPMGQIIRIRVAAKRAFSSAGGEKSVGVPGAECFVQTEEYAFRVKTPAKVDIPTFGPDASDARITCAHKGKQHTRTEKLQNLTEIAYRAEAAGQMMVGFGVVGLVVTAGQASGRDKSKDIWSFEKLDVVLK